MPFSFKKAPLVAAIALATTASVTHAQMLEEVIVTAQKRTESLQDVPISVSAMQGDKMQEAGIPNMAAMADYVPNLHIANAAVNTNIYMRGVGSGNNQGFEQSVGMYIDGIYMGRGRQYRNAFMDLERVEVLRGPQGTLFGRNTVAGAINITSASPDPGEVFQGEIAAAAESNDGLTVEGYLSGSPSENTGLRVGFKYRETEGYVDNIFTGDAEPEIEEASYRITFVWQPTDDLDINFKYSKSDEERVGAPSATWLYLNQDQRDTLFPNRTAFAVSAYQVTDNNFPGLAPTQGDDFSTFKDNGFGAESTLGFCAESGLGFCAGLRREPTLGIGRYPDGDDAEVENYALNVDYQLGDYTITSVTGFSEYTVASGSDVDWLPVRFIARDDDQDYDQFSQELRLTSPGGEFFDFVAGVYYDESELAARRLVSIDASFQDLFGDLSATVLFPALPDVPLRAIGIGATSLFAALSKPPLAYQAQQAGRAHLYELDSTSWAVFGQGTINLSDTFRLTLGLRYTREEKDVVSTQVLNDDLDGRDVTAFTEAGGSDDWQLARLQAVFFNTYAYNYKDDRSTDAWIPSINLQWDVGEDSMLYASFSQGFKSGGFTAADDGEPGGLGLAEFPSSCIEEPDGSVVISECYDPTVPNDDFEFDDETVDAFELGGKHTLLDGAMTVNWAAFYTQYSDLQTAIFKGVGFTVKNAGDSEILGIEVDAKWAATDNLVLGGNIAWLDATYDDFADAPCTAIQLDANPQCGVADPEKNLKQTFNDLSGEKTLYASDYSASVTWDYSYPLSEMEIFLSGEVNYRSEFNSAGDNDPIDEIDSYSKTNLRIGLRADMWEVMLYGRNIFDEAALSQSFDTPVLAGSHARFQEEGVVFGLRAKYIF